ncbi:MAG: hypothetical protein H6Q74_86 [Firmicutes bacterium]|nr:hypothetical protein [Bacillota bacterium]
MSKSEDFAMRNAVIAYVLNAIGSAFIGLVVCSVEVVMNVYQPEMFRYFVHSAVIGAIIGTVCRIVGYSLSGYMGHNIFRSLGLIFIIIAAAMALVNDIFNVSFCHLFVLLVIAEVLGLLTAYLNIRYAKKLNDRLKKKQATIRQNFNS